MNPDNHTWDLLVGALKGTLGEAEQREFDRWAAEAENRRFYNNLTRVWREIQQRAAAYEPDRDRLWRQLQQRIGTYEIPHADQLPKRRRSHLLQMAIAVAAAVAVTLFATRADLFRSAAETAEQRLCAFEGKSQARLSDGSTVWLHGGSTLTCDARFAAGERRVKLRGEGFFEVAKDSERPFTVEVEGLEISVHGTKFNVRTAADRYVSVSLVEGSVSLDTGRGSRRLLRPGEIACYDPDTRKVVIGRGNVAMESCWAAGKLVRTAVAGRNLSLHGALVRHRNPHHPGPRTQLRLHVHHYRRTARRDPAHHEPHQPHRLHVRRRQHRHDF